MHTGRWGSLMFTRKLCDFKSKWTMFFPCRYSIPKAASIAIISLFLRSIVLLIQKWKTLEKTSSSNSIQQLPVQKTDRKKKWWTEMQQEQSQKMQHNFLECNCISKTQINYQQCVNIATFWIFNIMAVVVTNGGLEAWFKLFAWQTSECVLRHMRCSHSLHDRPSTPTHTTHTS